MDSNYLASYDTSVKIDPFRLDLLVINNPDSITIESFVSKCKFCVNRHKKSLRATRLSLNALRLSKEYGWLGLFFADFKAIMISSMSGCMPPKVGQHKLINQLKSMMFSKRSSYRTKVIWFSGHSILICNCYNSTTHRGTAEYHSTLLTFLQFGHLTVCIPAGFLCLLESFRRANTRNFRIDNYHQCLQPLVLVEYCSAQN